MKSMIAKVMAECDRLKASSVAFPALGTGNLGFPSDVTAKIMVQAAHRYLQWNPNTSVKKVAFIIYQDEVLNSFQRELSALKLAPAMSSGLPGAHVPSVLPLQASLSQHAVRRKNTEPALITVAKGQLTEDQVSFI